MLLDAEFRTSDACVGILGLVLLYSLLKRIIRPTGRGTPLSGPKRTDWIWGVDRILLQSQSGLIFESWQKEFGDVFRIPSAMGRHHTVLMDARAIAHVLNANSYNYLKNAGSLAFFNRVLGGGILISEGEAHKKYRKAMNPGFAPAAIRAFTTVFLEAAFKVQDRWNGMVELSKTGDALVNVENWLDAISMDSIGIAGFSRDFDCINGNRPPFLPVFESLGNVGTGFFTILTIALSRTFPWVLRLPFKRNRELANLRSAMSYVARDILKERKSDVEEASEKRRSVIGSVMKAENRNMTEQEVLTELNTLMLAGYETTATSMAWALHELSVNPDIQDRLRKELNLFPDPNHDQLSNEMPYLDATVRETLRVHAAFPDLFRTAASADSIPLGRPMKGEADLFVDGLEVPAGAGILIPLDGMNISRDIWGADAHDFKPERWLDELPVRAKEIQGFHHILTFIDGPKSCIGKTFAVAEMKAVLSVLVRNFVFSPLKDGTDVRRNRAIAVRARNQDMQGLFIRVKRVGEE